METTQEILASVGYPTNILVIDFETYFDTEYSLTKMSTIEYIMDSRFSFTGIGLYEFCNRGGKIIKRSFVEPDKISADFVHKYNFAKYTVVYCNAKFDHSIMKHKFKLYPPFVIDIQDLSRHIEARRNSHSLDTLAPIYGSGRKFDTLKKTASGKHWDEMSKADKVSHASYAINDATQEYHVFNKLLPMISNHKIELAAMRQNLRAYTEPRFRVDIPAAKQLLVDMEAKYDEIPRIIKPPLRNAVETISGSISFAKLIASMLPEGETIPVKAGKPSKNMVPFTGPGLIPAFAKDDEGLKNLLVHPNKRIQQCIMARMEMKSWPLHINRVKRFISQASVLDGKLGTPLHYHGASTGRYTGGEKINLLNLGSRNISPLIKKIKTLLLPPEGYKFIIHDLSQIEVRILALIAGQKDILDAFKEGRDIYSEFASKLFNEEVRKPLPSDSLEKAKLMGLRRHVGKENILGDGYNMGPDRAYEQCKKNDALLAMIQDGSLTFDMIKKGVYLYRATYTKITKLWDDVEQLFRDAVVDRVPGKLRNTGLKFLPMGSHTVAIELPSGRKLLFPGCTEAWGTLSWRYGKLYGGLITENICQAISRDIMIEAVLRIEARGIPVALHVYDSIVGVAPDSEADKAFDIVQKEMTKPPKWMPSIPLAVEGEISDHYE